MFPQATYSRNKLKGFLQYLKDEHVDKKGYEMPNVEKLELKRMTNSDFPQQENVSDCGVCVCLFYDYILNGYKLNFKQDDMMEGIWWQKIILSILTPCDDNGNDTYKEGMKYDNDKNMVEIIQPTEKAKGKPKEIIEELIWTQATILIARSQQLGEGLQYKENYDLNVECKDVCTIKEQCTNKIIQNNNWKSVEKRQTENGKE